MFADVIIGLSVDKLDRVFTYKIPEQLFHHTSNWIGKEVIVPFGKGSREVHAFVIGIKDRSDFEEDRIKEIVRIDEKSTHIEEKRIVLAEFIRNHFGGTMNEALRTVIQIPKTIERKKKKTIFLKATIKEACEALRDFQKKKHTAKERVLRKAIEEKEYSYEAFVKEFPTQGKVFEILEKEGWIGIRETVFYRNPLPISPGAEKEIPLNDEQMEAITQINKYHKKGESKKYLLFGVTGSGKTEVYINVMQEVLQRGEQVIFLIPEISLTFQMVERFSARFGNRISIIHSRMSAGEKYDQYIRAMEGDIDIIVGPRSAVFMPFQNLGLIIMDEEHSESYNSSKTPRYHTRDVAIKRAELEGADIILGSATPGLSTVKLAGEGYFKTLSLTKRPDGILPPEIEVVDLREELKCKNRSIFSYRLQGLIEDRLVKKEQIMLFINRRGYAGFVSCRSCGEPITCPNCSVSFTYHKPDQLQCHYCGFQTSMPKQCPSCHSPYIKTFGLGTEQVEELTKKRFPNARVIRMDADTTTGKNGHNEVLQVFREGKADILVGTQMIVKGHNFPNVSLVGILAADLSLFSNDFRSAERTYQLLVQAAGRAGRDKIPGKVVIQSYKPEHYVIQTCASGNYKEFYQREFRYRSLANYPPSQSMLTILFSSTKEEEVERVSEKIWKKIEALSLLQLYIKAPIWDRIAKLNQQYRKVIHLKSGERKKLIQVKDFVEREMKEGEFAGVSVQFDFPI